ncbi:MAG: helix-turn-helix transcriptional regulator [Oscillospiraceae bacterium]|nr:helix-turn-helix transcriptional regulator [Oscillospiraceae bacterium]MDD4546402.1 helix-turn-helix transcriptional regulator [Oscillospiraceae bacterium]
MPTIGSRLKELRATTGKSQDNLSKMFDSNQSTLNRYENDQTDPPCRILLWYADYFDVSMDYIYCRTDNPQGRLYEFKPNIPNGDLRQFIEMCFDKDSPMSERLKQSIITLFEEDGK